MDIMEEPSVSVLEFEKILNDATKEIKVFNIIKTSLNIGLFDVLEKKHTCLELSNKCSIDYDMFYYLLEALVKLDLIEEKNGYYINKEISNIYLNSNSYFQRKTIIKSLNQPLSNWNDLENVLYSKEIKQDENFFKFIIKAMAEDAVSGELQETLNIVNNYDEFRNSKTLLDIGGGHGLYSIGFKKLNPNLKAFVFDFPDVLNETKKFCDKFNSDINLISGNFYEDDLEGSYDIIFSSYNPGGKNAKIAEKIYNSLNMNGLFINKQYFPTKTELNLNDILNNLEWNFTNFDKSNKGKVRYTFKNDLSYDSYLKNLENLGFDILDIFPINHHNASFGTTAEDKIIIAKKVR